MAATEQSNGGHDCSSAREFVEERLETMDSPVKPSELANDYDCSNAHMRHTLSDLVDDGQAERVGHGEYAAVSAEAAEAEATDVDRDVSTEDTGDMRPSLGGPVRSGDRDTPDQSPVEIDEDERADVDLSGTVDDDGDSGGLDDDRVDDGPRLSRGTAIIAGSILLVVAVVWIQVHNQSDETPDETGDEADDEPAGESAQPNTGGWV